MPGKHAAAVEPLDALRMHLLELLEGGGAHVGFDLAVADMPVNLRGVKLLSQPHTPWRLLEHMRLAQWDILEFVRNAQHESPPWPEGYWPIDDAPPSSAAWSASVKSFRRDLDELKALVADASADLLRPLPHGQGQTLAREALLAADHTAYHLGQLVLLRRLLGAWHE